MGDSQCVAKTVLLSNLSQYRNQFWHIPACSGVALAGGTKAGEHNEIGSADDEAEKKGPG